MSQSDVVIGNTTIKDSGERRQFATGAQRDANEGKGFFSLLPYQGLLEVAQVFEAGARKYNRSNWRLGMPLSTYLDSALRHAHKAASGWTDENHAAMACWGFLTFIETRHMIAQGHLPKELNDIDDWLTAEGVQKALEEIRKINESKKDKMGTAIASPNLPKPKVSAVGCMDSPSLNFLYPEVKFVKGSHYTISELIFRSGLLVSYDDVAEALRRRTVSINDEHTVLDGSIVVEINSRIILRVGDKAAWLVPQ